MAIKTYLLYCEICNYKKITDGSDSSLIEVKTSSIMTAIPTLDPETKKAKPAKFKPQRKRFKCPLCGRVVFPKKLETKNEEPQEDNNSGHQTSNEGSEV